MLSFCFRKQNAKLWFTIDRFYGKKNNNFKMHYYLDCTLKIDDEKTQNENFSRKGGGDPLYNLIKGEKKNLRL